MSLASFVTTEVNVGTGAVFSGSKVVEFDEGMLEGTGTGEELLATEVETEEVVRCNAEDNAAESDATDPITDDIDVVEDVDV